MKRAHLWAVFFLALFLGAKCLEYHPLDHVDDETSDRCELCDFAALLDGTPFQAPETMVIESPDARISEPVAENTFTFRVISGELGAGQFYRPPPPARLTL